MSGRKHSDKSKQIMSDAKKGENNPNFGKNHTEETRTKISDAISGENHPNYGKNMSNETKSKISDAQKGKKNSMFGQNHSDESKKIMSEAKKGENNPNSQQIEVIDLKEITRTYYNSFREAARALNIPNHCIISNYIKNNQKKPYKVRYTFK